MKDRFYCGYLLYTRNMRSVKAEFYSEEVYFSLEHEIRDTDYQKGRFRQDLYFFVLPEPLWQRFLRSVRVK